MELLHQDPDSVIVNVDVVRSTDGEIVNSPVRTDQLDYAVGEVPVTTFDIPDDVDKGFIGVGDLLRSQRSLFRMTISPVRGHNRPSRW